MIKEWETLNILCGLAVGAVLTMLQLDNVTKGATSYVAAVITLASAFWACVLGSVFIVRFDSMRAPLMEYRWMKEAQEWNVNRLSNMWFIIAMPAIWATWAVFALSVVILAMVFPGINGDSPSALTKSAQWASFFCALLILAVGSMGLILALCMFHSWGGREVPKKFVWVPYTSTSQGVPVANKLHMNANIPSQSASSLCLC
ncbi:hypothetical protein BD410DRAFT_303277 [Rickenella mellea]|uniref:Uncharacterized protein n=1 Tax=Rickenella mellea TaxID=50990 RepID=A0A4Y7Q2K5_9AGAM|nr:hypothetical protein BD410DRAFT_303277 [Rickenella mellea]